MFPKQSMARRRASARLLSCVLLLASSSAEAISFDVSFVNSTYQVQSGDTYADLLAEHNAGSLIQLTQVDALVDISTSVYAAGVTRNYSMMMSTTLEFTQAATYTFQVGTDWGFGGVAAVLDATDGSLVSEYVRTDDIWWDLDWAHEDVFTTSIDAEVGDRFTFAWIGFEGCCGGSSTLRFSVDGDPFEDLSETNIQPYAVPEPSTALLCSGGLWWLRGRRRSAHG